MEAFTKIPGLQQISEDVFKLLDKKSLMECRLVNSSWKNVLDQPTFWLKKLKDEKIPSEIQESLKALVKQLEDDQLAKDSAKEWLEKFNLENLPLDVQSKWRGLAQELEDDQLSKEFILLMIKIFKRKEIINNLLEIAVRMKGAKLNHPDFLVIDVNMKGANKYPELAKFIIEHENVNIKLDLYVANPYGKAYDKVENASPIHLAALFGFTDVLKKLTNKYDTPLFPLFGWTPW